VELLRQETPDRTELYLDPNRAKPRILTNLTIPGTLMESQASADVLYTLSIRLPESSGRVLKASVPLCQLQASRFQETLVFHIDGSGQVWHLDYSVSAPNCEPGLLVSSQAVHP
jgi:hypothetical protein